MLSIPMPLYQLKNICQIANLMIFDAKTSYNFRNLFKQI